MQNHDSAYHSMHKLRERDIEIDFTDALSALIFDQTDPDIPEFHDFRNMPRVDFIVELPSSIFFIEIKDPGRAGLEDTDTARFLRKLEDGKLEDSLVNKYICTFLFRWAERKLEKSVHFVILTSLDEALIPNLNDALEKRFAPILKKSSRWERMPLGSCQVHSLRTWEEVYPTWPVTRLGTNDVAGK